jgi:hypothetical protein
VSRVQKKQVEKKEIIKSQVGELRPSKEILRNKPKKDSRT